MYSLRWLLAMFLMISFLAAAVPGWADSKPKHQQHQEGWQDQYDRSSHDQPPGWDKGKKTGWQGQDLPPGQQKKYRQRYNNDPNRRRYVPPPELVPVPVPVPVPR